MTSKEEDYHIGNGNYTMSKIQKNVAKGRGGKRHNMIR
jgi:hypothetical protein